ncbi:kelch domain-containing protein [Dactylonectria macrodidyma]|uniref:Trimethylguanosine synthase n=1 Tax=Dactylonectria macrodidyma TaxID=307937 RepID=A0A9P9FRL5_9HYPO|nr:kelch domain-containing protein [Dactylonectria macrodidyma]
MGNLGALVAPESTKFSMKPAEILPLTDQCHHYQGKNEVPWDIQKYFSQRYSIFSLYDEGVYMTDDAWFGVTPEPVAKQVSNDMYGTAEKKHILIDVFGGAGGNSIAFALSRRWSRVISIERDASTLACAQNNAEIYGVDSGVITWIHGDSFEYMDKLVNRPEELHPSLRLDLDETVIFASPPWGGPGYRTDEVFDLYNMQPYNLGDLHNAYQRLDHALFLPRTSDIRQIAKLAPSGRKIDVVQYCMEGASKALVAYLPATSSTKSREFDYSAKSHQTIMAKDKKKGSEAKKARKADKQAKQANKGEKKAKSKAAKVEGSDAEDVDLDEVLEEYRRQQELFLKVTETVCEAPPKARAASTLMASPHDSNSLLLFGGEYFNGSLAQFYNDLNIYNISRDEWRCVTSPNAPLPRSGHAWTRAGNPNHVYLFGGEFSSPKQGTFHHYNDFWRLEPATREWTKIEVKGKDKSPSARSGHRMTYWKQYIILFGGFQDTSNQTKYLADLWIFDTVNFVWHTPQLPPAQLKPDARSSFTLLPHDQGAVLYGGYSRVKSSVQIKQKGKGGHQAQRNVLVPKVHEDSFFLRMIQPPTDANPNIPPTVRWEKRKKPANAPNPTRAGATMTWHKGRGILFGGVHDIEQSEEGIDSEFFNQLFAWNVERNRFMPLALRKPRQQKKNAPDQRVNRRGRAQANEDELLRQLAALEKGASLEDADDIELDKKDEVEYEKPIKEMPVTMEPPHVRFNSQMAIQDDVLYIYGGTFEKGDREFTFDDLYAIDLGKLDGCKQIFTRPVEDWIVSDWRSFTEKQTADRSLQESEDEDEDDEDDEGDEDEDDEDEENEAEEQSQKHFTPSKRKKKVDEASEAASEPSEAPAETSEEDDTETATSVDDGLPHPRPFETRREFFVRTTAEWQEILMTNLRWKNIQPESLTIKEIKTMAFELSEEKWWDSREEITALEEEQEAAGIQEVVSLAERGDAGAGGPGARRR